MPRQLTYVFEIIDEQAFSQTLGAAEGPEMEFERLGLRRIAVASGDQLTQQSQDVQGLLTLALSEIGLVKEAVIKLGGA